MNREQNDFASGESSNEFVPYLKPSDLLKTSLKDISGGSMYANDKSMQDVTSRSIFKDALMCTEEPRSMTAQKAKCKTYELGVKRKLQFEETQIAGSHETPNKRSRKQSPSRDAFLRNIQ